MPAPKRLNIFERYLTLWVALCMIAGVTIGKVLPGLTDAIRGLEFGKGSQINVAIALLIWLMVYPMMLKIDLTSIAVAAAEQRLAQLVAAVDKNDDELRKTVASRAYVDGGYPLDVL